MKIDKANLIEILKVASEFTGKNITLFSSVMIDGPGQRIIAWDSVTTAVFSVEIKEHEDERICVHAKRLLEIVRQLSGTDGDDVHLGIHTEGEWARWVSVGHDFKRIAMLDADEFPFFDRPEKIEHGNGDYQSVGEIPVGMLKKLLPVLQMAKKDRSTHPISKYVIVDAKNKKIGACDGKMFWYSHTDLLEDGEVTALLSGDIIQKIAKFAKNEIRIFENKIKGEWCFSADRDGLLMNVFETYDPITFQCPDFSELYNDSRGELPTVFRVTIEKHILENALRQSSLVFDEEARFKLAADTMEISSTYRGDGYRSGEEYAKNDIDISSDIPVNSDKIESYLSPKRILNFLKTIGGKQKVTMEVELGSTSDSSGPVYFYGEDADCIGLIMPMLKPKEKEAA